MPNEARQDMMASALDRVLMKGLVEDSTHQVGGRAINFNPEAVVRGAAAGAS